MEALTHRERELVALGAALGSNCVPCIEYHIPEARKTGLTDAQISHAVRVADKLRQVPARKVLQTALGMLSEMEKQDRAREGGLGNQTSQAGHAGPRQGGALKQVGLTEAQILPSLNLAQAMPKGRKEQCGFAESESLREPAAQPGGEETPCCS